MRCGAERCGAVQRKRLYSDRIPGVSTTALFRPIFLLLFSSSLFRISLLYASSFTRAPISFIFIASALSPLPVPLARIRSSAYFPRIVMSNGKRKTFSRLRVNQSQCNWNQTCVESKGEATIRNESVRLKYCLALKKILYLFRATYRQFSINFYTYVGSTQDLYICPTFQIIWLPLQLKFKVIKVEELILVTTFKHLAYENTRVCTIQSNFQQFPCSIWFLW